APTVLAPFSGSPPDQSGVSRPRAERRGIRNAEFSARRGWATASSARPCLPNAASLCVLQTTNAPDLVSTAVGRIGEPRTAHPASERSESQHDSLGSEFFRTMPTAERESTSVRNPNRQWTDRRPHPIATQ